MYKISVIIPVFNAEKTLHSAFDSILNQTLGFENIEVIFVDDCSTDNSRNIINEFVAQYDNVKLICHDENSGYAGKPRNTGILNATADYVMFLDPDDQFYDYSFEFLYNKIIGADVDFVSGNYNQLIDGEYYPYDWNFLKLDYENYIDSIKDNMDLLRLPASVFTKIIRKSLLIENDLRFPEDIPSQDLVFITETLLNANGILFINRPIVKYTIWEGKSQTANFSKKSLSGNLKAYTMFYKILLGFDVDSSWMALRILNSYWMKHFILSKASRSEKIDVLISGKYLFDEYKKSSRLKPYKKYRELFDLIHKEEYLDAVKLTEYLALTFPESKYKVKEIVKNKKIYFLFGEFNLNIGGVGSAVINRATYLAEMGYDVNLLNLETIKNYEFIRDFYYENGTLSRKINFINMYEYYSNKNTLFAPVKHDLNYKVNSNNELNVEKVINDDDSINLNYYSPDDNELVKTELYVDESLIYEEIGFNRNFYTKDGFKYLSRIKRDNKSLYILYARNIACPLEFKSLSRLVYYFINEVTLHDEKPFLVCDSTDHWYNIVGIDKNMVIKIASMHSNPYLIKEDERKLNPKIKHFQILDELKAFVLLTDSVKNDLKKEVKFKNFVVIPNFVDNKLLDYSPVEKDLNVIRIFCRISPEKQLSDAIHAFNLILQKNDDLIMEIYGRASLTAEKEELDKLNSLVQELKLEDKVIFKGFKSDVSDEMKKSLFTLLTSQFEGLPLALLESMTNSTPVISYDINYGPRDVITDGVDGIIVEPNNIEKLADSMWYLLDNPEIAVEMGRNAKEKIKKEFSTDAVGKKWENLFADVYIKSTVSDYKKQIKMLNDYDGLVRQNKKIKNENKKLKRFKNEILNSTSWKITKPIRKLKRLLKFKR